ncbi:hypothetical protein Pmani_038249 [Petrolisthes manimaculis]|uniref:Uncharacterized protein n=1 Tax=Petrolisthes manimaculis TaxID=1843537 RepID=A0AAE1TMI7_9EUCA|nr:hypothetical protein Pmani_038249 [Petrolisthes manimaculis]
MSQLFYGLKLRCSGLSLWLVGSGEFSVESVHGLSRLEMRTVEGCAVSGGWERGLSGWGAVSGWRRGLGAAVSGWGRGLGAGGGVLVTGGEGWEGGCQLVKERARG